MADAVPIDIEAAAAAADLAVPHLPGANRAGVPPATPPGVPAGAVPPDDVMAFIRRMEARMIADEERAVARAETLANLQRQVADQAAELALLRGPPDAAVAADQMPAFAAAPGAFGAAGPASSASRRSHLSVHSTPPPPSSPRATAVPVTRRLNLDDDNASVISFVSRAAPTSKNYQNFLRAGEKSLLFSGSDQSDVNEWLVSVEELADTHGADYEEVLRGVPLTSAA